MAVVGLLLLTLALALILVEMNANLETRAQMPMLWTRSE